MNLLHIIRARINGVLDFSGRLCLVTFLNPYSYVVARSVEGVFKRFSVIGIDGSMLVLALRMIGLRVSRRSFDLTSLAPVVFGRCAKEGLSVALVGGEPGVAEEAARHFRRLYGSDLKVDFIHDGFFESDARRESVIGELVVLAPRVLIVGMGTPLQERFLIDVADAGWCGLGLTCGGFFHQTASKGGDYYPKWIDKLNLRWLYRMFDEPKLIKRYFKGYSEFCFVFILDVLKGDVRSRLKDFS